MTESAEALIGAIGRLVNEERVLCVCDRVCCGAKLRATACHALAHKLSLNIVYALQYHSVLSCILARPLRSGLGEGLPRPSLGVDCPTFVGERPRFPPAGKCSRECRTRAAVPWSLNGSNLVVEVALIPYPSAKCNFNVFPGRIRIRIRSRISVCT